MKNKLILIIFLIGFLSLSQAQINPKNIDIVRDKWGVPHIYGKTDAETSYGLAWAHAEDDFKTIQQTLLAGKGLLGRKLGKKGAAIDYFVKLIRARDIVNTKINTLTPQFRKVLNGYVQGINAYAKAHKKEVTLRKLFPITEKDLLTSYVISLSVMDKVDRVIGDLFKNKITENPYSIYGSNAIAISAKKTTNGKTFLDINSHQPLNGPASWYEAHLNSEEGWNILGGLFAGGTTVFQGVTPNLAWGHTVNYPDKVDVFKLKTHPTKENYYEFDGKWLPLEVKKVKLKVKILGIPIGVKKKAYWSVYGATVKNDSGYYSVRFAANMGIKAPEQWYYMNKAQNFSQFKKALKMTAITGFNIVYADKYDTIFYVSNGKIPIRNTRYDWTKVLPGNTSKTLWKSFHPFADLPQILNPKSGYVFNMNNTVYNASGDNDNLSPMDLDQTMGYPFKDNNRSIRFQQLIHKLDKLSYTDFKRIKYDITLPDSLYYNLDANVFFRLKPSQHPNIKNYLEGLQKWNRTTNKDSYGATLFKVIYDVIARGSYKKITTKNAPQIVTKAQAHLLENFKTIHVKLGTYQVHQRGNVELPVEGLPDVIAATHTRPYKNKERIFAGESHIILVQFDKNGPVFETVNAYGATNNPKRKHYTDQMKLYVNHKLKKMTLNKTEIYKNAESIYHPE
ncbi:MAG: penicillin acylase family protein [Flavobacteriaceae bacterium]